MLVLEAGGLRPGSMMVLTFIVTVWPGLIVPMVNVTVLPLIVLVPCDDEADLTMNILGTGSLTTAFVTGVVPPLWAVSVKTTGSPGLAVWRSATFVKVSVPGVEVDDPL